MSALPDDLSRTRALFEHWRATRSGREKIPEKLWQAVIALRDRYPASQLCRELHLSAGALRARLREAEAQPTAPAAPEFVPLPLEALGLPVANRVLSGRRLAQRRKFQSRIGDFGVTIASTCPIAM